MLFSVKLTHHLNATSKEEEEEVDKKQGRRESLIRVQVDLKSVVVF